jgi:hypothetical protein
MKRVVVGSIVAILLFAGGIASWREARQTRQLAAAHERLATLHYDAMEGVSQARGFLGRLPWPIGSGAEDAERYRATVVYWQSRYTALTDMLGATGAPAPNDPDILLMAANAAFRSSSPQAADKKAVVDRLDGVMQAYADVLRKAPSLGDAAFNYEVVARLRDAASRAAAGRGARDRDRKVAAPKPSESVSIDLPSGPTLHGLPGAPPEGTDMSTFKTVTPMRYDEREDQTEPGRGKEFKRKG